MQAFLLKHWPILALGLALLASLSFGAVQTSRLSSANLAVTTGQQSIKLLTERVNSDRSLIATRDQLIAEQNQAVEKMVTAAQADRTAYLARLAEADKVAKRDEASVENIMAQKTEATDELGRARAALELIRDTLSAESPTNVR